MLRLRIQRMLKTLRAARIVTRNHAEIMKKLDVRALANTFAIIDLVLHLLFHLWGWYLPRSLERAMHEFVIGLDLHITEQFTPTFLIFWILEAMVFWLLGYAIASLYNKLSK